MKIILLLLLCLQSVFAYNSSKIIVIADVHGDIPRLKNILQDANVIDGNDNWIASENTHVIQLGDQIDPKEVDNHDIPKKHHFAMIYYTHELEKKARLQNSQFVSHIGNHELKNLDKIIHKMALRKIIAQRPIITIKDSYLFCHGAFKLHHYYLMNIYNKTIDDVNKLWYAYVMGINLFPDDIILLQNLVLDKVNGILYTRTDDTKYAIDKLFNILGIDYMFVGHTETTYIHVQNKIWHLDLVLKTAFDSNAYNYIIIENNNIYIKSIVSTKFHIPP